MKVRRHRDLMTAFMLVFDEFVMDGRTPLQPPNATTSPDPPDDPPPSATPPSKRRNGTKTVRKPAR